MKALFIMQGAPGSGKSTVAQALAAKFKGLTAIVSTDDYWERGGIYAFENDLLPRAHAWNEKRAYAAMEVSTPIVIIDNTNITQKAADPYIDIAKKFDYTVTVIRVDPGLAECLRRNETRAKDRRIPDEVIATMYHSMETINPQKLSSVDLLSSS